MNRKGIAQGVYSHETALALFGLTDVQPEKLHMTFPRGHRRVGDIPDALILHHADIDPSECEERLGYRVTNPHRTLTDLLRSMTLLPEFIKQALQEAQKEGLLTLSQYQTLKEIPRIGSRIRAIMGCESA